MAKLIFYRQKRYDGGVRTGIELDGEPIAERFDPGSAERDTALLWYADLRCEGPGVPSDPDTAADWLLEQTPTIRDAFARYAEKLVVGADPDSYPLIWSDFHDLPAGVTMMIACSAIRRIDAREMSSELTRIGEHWEELVRELDVPQSADDLR